MYAVSDRNSTAYWSCAIERTHDWKRMSKYALLTTPIHQRSASRDYISMMIVLVHLGIFQLLRGTTFEINTIIWRVRDYFVLLSQVKTNLRGSIISNTCFEMTYISRNSDNDHIVTTSVPHLEELMDGTRNVAI